MTDDHLPTETTKTDTEHDQGTFSIATFFLLVAQGSSRNIGGRF